MFSQHFNVPRGLLILLIESMAVALSLLGSTMTKALTHTKAGIKRRLGAALEVGLYIIGIAPDGTVLTSHIAPHPDKTQKAVEMEGEVVL